MRLEVEQRGQREGDMRSEKHQGDVEPASEATLRTQLLGQGNREALGGAGQVTSYLAAAKSQAGVPGRRSHT